VFYAYWYGGNAAWPTGAKLVKHVRELKRHGVRGFIPQHALDNARVYIERHDVARVCRDEGVSLMLGLGLDRGRSTPTDAQHEVNATRSIIAALDAQKAGTVARVSLDWESYWKGRRAMAERIAQRVLDAHPDAALHTEDCPWWAPLFFIDAHGRKRPTHPSAPTREFGRLVRERYVQAYGAQADGSPDGRSLAWLAWSRSPTQYLSLGPWTIGLTSQMYARSLADQINTLLREPEQRLWTFDQADPRAKRALLVVEALRVRGFELKDAVRDFQRAEGIAVDGIVGPVTLYHLGLGPKP
jgi:hypothetical protein